MKTAKAPTVSSGLADRYIRCEDFADRIDGIELSPDIWAVFAQLTQSRTATEIAQHLKLDVEAVNAALRRLVRRKLVRKHVLAWRDYAAINTPAPIPAPVTSTHFEGSTAPFMETLPPFPKAPAASPQSTRSAPPFWVGPAHAHAPASTPATPRSPIISFRLSSSSAPARQIPAVSLRIESPRRATTPTNATTAHAPRLRPILEAIGAKAGGGVAGQLLVYRVFLQIPTELMQAAGLHSLSLVDEHYTIPNPELRDALAAAARQHAGVDIDALTTV